MDFHKKRVFLTFAVVLLGLVMFFSQPDNYSGAVVGISGDISCDDLDNKGKKEGMDTSDIYVKSSTKSWNVNENNNKLIETKLDKCENYGKLRENYCVKTHPYVQTKIVECIYGCYDGACKLPPCVDHDLGKFRYVTKGTVTGLNKQDPKIFGTPPLSQYPKEFTDYCASKNALVEYYCSKGGEVVSEVKACECSGGRCV